MKEPHLALLCAAFSLAGCSRTPAVIHAAVTDKPPAIITVHAGRLRRHVRSTGVVQAVHVLSVLTPQITGISQGSERGGNLTLTRLIENGATVKAGDLLAEFDRIQQLEAGREAQAKYEDLQHQVEEKQAKHASDAAKRRADLQKAEADLAKAEIQIRKGPIISEIDHLKNQSKLEDARVHVASLQKSNRYHDEAETAAIRILELQRDRQKVGVERANRNADLLQLRAPIAGMVALDNIWKQGTMGHAQEGDSLWPGNPLLRIFDPSQMEVMASVAEPDGATLTPKSKAVVRLDAYPDLVFTARFESASPVATSAVGSSIRLFSARFRLDQSDAHLLPDLSAALDIEAPAGPEGPVAPRAALHYRNDKAYVLRVNTNGAAVEQPVALSAFDASQVQIKSGLTEGDRILLAEQP